jgi:uncharacterized protein involved in propanediol utilization
MVWVAGHFGEWIQGCLGETVALVTMACPVKGVEASWGKARELVLSDPAGVLGPGRAQAFLAALRLPASGIICVAPDLPPGVGAGMSTAALVALARSASAQERRIADACLVIEGAVDPLMLAAPDAVLWAPRRAMALADLPRAPKAEIVGGVWGPPVPTDPLDAGFPQIDDLVAAWRRGPDLPGAARLASLSAARTTARRGPKDDPTARVARALGALGWARAHTGSARGLIFSPGTVPAGAETALKAEGYSNVFRFLTGHRP